MSTFDDNERSIWGDEQDEGDELVVIKRHDLDNAPIPERVPDLPAREVPRRFGDTLDDSNDDVNEWVPDVPAAPSATSFGAIVDGIKIVAILGATLAVIGGLGLVIYLAARQYGVL